MTRRMQLLVYALLPAATAIIAGIVSILTVALGWQTGLSVLGSLAVFPLLFLFLYQFTRRPRLFIYTNLVSHGIIWPALAAIVGLFWWVYIVAGGESLIERRWDVMLIVGGILFSITINDSEEVA